MDRGKEHACAELARAICDLGYPEEFAQVLASELRGEQSIRRMAAYVRQVQPTSPEQIADELLAITQQREAWVEQKISERANAAITSFYNRPRS